VDNASILYKSEAGSNRPPPDSVAPLLYRFVLQTVVFYGVPSPPKINFLFSTLLYIFNTTFLIATQLFVFNTTFYFQHNFLFSTQLFIFNTTFYFQHNFFYPTAIHSCHVSRARTFFEKSCKNVVKL
jgi:hypothetical protein